MNVYMNLLLKSSWSNKWIRDKYISVDAVKKLAVIVVITWSVWRFCVTEIKSLAVINASSQLLLAPLSIYKYLIPARERDRKKYSISVTQNF